MDKDYGSKIEYDPLWEGPLTHRRRTTNFLWLIVFIIYMVIWGSVSFYAIKNGDWSKFKIDINSTDDNTISPNLTPNSDQTKVIMKLFIKMMIATIVLSAIFVLLLRYFAKFMVYTALTLVLIGLILGIVKLFQLAYIPDESKRLSIALPIIVTVFTVFIVIYVFCVRRKISLACGVIKESGKAMISLPSTLVFPLLPVILWAGIIVNFFIVFASLKTFPKEIQDTKGGMLALCHAVNIVGVLWGYLFVDGFNQMVLAGTFSTWFWTHNKDNIPSLMIVRFTGTTVRYHLGTIALGSFIITICKIITTMVKSIRDQARQNGGAGAIFATCLSCLVELIEQIIEYITENAYIMCATHGTDFCTSAKNAFNLIMRNVVRCYVVTQITNIVIGVSGFLVMLISVGITVGTTQQSIESAGQVAMVPLFVFAVISLAIANYIFSVLNMAVRTLFISALEDFERHDGSNERPYYMSYKLRKLFLKDSSPTSAV